MRVAVTYENGQVFAHFGKTPAFQIYDVADGRITGYETVSTAGSGGHGALATFLQSPGVDTLICGGIGEGAQGALEQAGIAVYGGVSGPADQAVQDLLSGRLTPGAGACGHHGQHAHGGHHCGHHGQHPAQPQGHGHHQPGEFCHCQGKVVE